MSDFEHVETSPAARHWRVDPPVHPPATSPTLGRLDAWELWEKVGDGPLCEVYRAGVAQAGSASAPYAVKVLRAVWQGDARGFELFQREVCLGRQIQSPHVIAVLDARLSVAPFYAVMPWLEGQTLAQGIAGQPAPLAKALWYARQAAEGLLALHAGGWLHGDVKPSNLFVSRSGHVTLIDLGFARRPEAPATAADRLVLGTVSYLAPEAITSALRADIRSDIYSLGVVLYELLSGRRPFVASDLAALVAMHRQSCPVELRAMVPHLPRKVAALVHQMLAKDPWRRPQTPAEVVDRLVTLEIEHFDERQPLLTVAAGIG